MGRGKLRMTSPRTAQRAMVEVLVKHMGLPNDASRELEAFPEIEDLNLPEMARMLLHIKGVKGVAEGDLMERALTTSDLPAVLGDVVNKVLLNAYSVAPGTFQAWTAKGFTNDFRTLTVTRACPPSELFEVTEDDEYKALKIVDGQETAKLSTYGGILGISRQALVNDDSSALSNIGKMLGVTTKLTQNRKVYSVLMSNPSLSDGKAIFHVDRGNLLSGAGSALSRDSLATALKTMRCFTDDAGNPLSVEPKYLIVPPSLEITANELCFSDSIPGQSNPAVPNLFKKLGLVPIVEPLLEAPSITGYSSTAWYLLPDPELWPVVMTLALSRADNLEPYVEERPKWKSDGAEWKARTDFAAIAVGYRAIKSVGA